MLYVTQSSHNRREKMQQQFDFDDIELANLMRRIDKLDPVAQAEAVVKHLDGYTQKELGDKLGRTRDWIAKRVQFMRALEKVTKKAVIWLLHLFDLNRLPFGMLTGVSACDDEMSFGRDINGEANLQGY